MTLQPNQLDQSVGFTMGVAYRKLTGLLQQRLKAYDITPEQWSVLYHISRTDGMIQRDIAELAEKDHPTTTRILDHLLKKGLIEKQVNAEDRRAFLVTLTELGHQLLEQTTPIEHSITVDIQQCLSEDEFESFMNALRRIHTHASQLMKS